MIFNCSFCHANNVPPSKYNWSCPPPTSLQFNQIYYYLFITHKTQHKKPYIIQIQHISKINKKDKCNQRIKPQ